MSTQFSFFGSDPELARARLEDENLRKKKIQDSYKIDFCELDEFMQTHFPKLECQHQGMSSLLSHPIRISIFRSFAVLYLWDQLGKSFQEIEKWLRTPQAEFQDKSPVQFMCICWHCASDWMRDAHQKILKRGKIHEHH